MAAIIGSARINEKGTLTGGKAGDQTGGEVSTQTFYVHKKGWIILRAKDPAIAKKLATAMQQACSNNHIGYCQTHKNDLINVFSKYGEYATLGAININTETDCGGLVRVCILQATGKRVPDFNTATEKATLEATGLFDTIEYAPGTPLYTGDILVTKTKGHTAIVTSGLDRSKITQFTKASSNTLGSATITLSKPVHPTLKLGSKGEAVKEWQKIVGVVIDGDFGHNTENATKIWQKANGLVADGIAGSKSWAVATGTTIKKTESTEYNVRVLTALNIRKGPAQNYSVISVIRDNGVYTIVEDKNGWGKLKSGAGWIALKYTKRV